MGARVCGSWCYMGEKSDIPLIKRERVSFSKSSFRTCKCIANACKCLVEAYISITPFFHRFLICVHSCYVTAFIHVRVCLTKFKQGKGSQHSWKHCTKQRKLILYTSYLTVTWSRISLIFMEKKIKFLTVMYVNGTKGFQFRACCSKMAPCATQHNHMGVSCARV